MMREGFDIKSNDNALFTTSMCNNRCIMCCQPPMSNDDIVRRYKYNIYLVDNAPKELASIGITGGEPTLLGDKFFSLVQHIRTVLPDTEIHILSNGRAFADRTFTQKLANIGPIKILLGIPLHSDNQIDHDFIAGASGAFNETMCGLYNLARYEFDIELRIVLTKINYERLPKMSDFIFRNLPFVRYVSLMGLEFVGYTVKNADRVWIDPTEMSNPLSEAVSYLSGVGMDVSIFNLLHCLLPEPLWQFARKSISDWKNKFEPFCDSCSKKADCCGLFGTSIKQSPNLNPFI